MYIMDDVNRWTPLSEKCRSATDDVSITAFIKSLKACHAWSPYYIFIETFIPLNERMTSFHRKTTQKGFLFLITLFKVGGTNDPFSKLPSPMCMCVYTHAHTRMCARVSIYTVCICIISPCTPTSHGHQDTSVDMPEPFKCHSAHCNLVRHIYHTILLPPINIFGHVHT